MPSSARAQGTFANYLYEFSPLGVSSTDEAPPSTGNVGCPPGCPPFWRQPVDSVELVETVSVGFCAVFREPDRGPDVDRARGAQRGALGEVGLARLGSVRVRKGAVGPDPAPPGHRSAVRRHDRT